MKTYMFTPLPSGDTIRVQALSEEAAEAVATERAKAIIGNTGVEYRGSYGPRAKTESEMHRAYVCQICGNGAFSGNGVCNSCVGRI